MVMSFAIAVLLAVCLRLLLVLVGDVSVTSAVLMIVVVEEDELAVSSSMIIRRLDGVVVGEGESDKSEERERSEATMYSRLFISISKQPFAKSSSPDRKSRDPRRSFFVLE